ncbi:MAG: hypothetical protein KJ626_15430 [Verrucomicrobia bacterium]|nr:hypothetical protein [Verrucomicrobiota bacterium]
MMHRLLPAVLIAILAVTSLHAGQGIEPPPKTGVGLTLYTQQQDYDLSGGSVALGGLPIPLTMIPNVDVASDLYEVNIKIDTWILPFLNVFGIVGQVNGETEISTFLPPGFAASLGGGPALADLAGPLDLKIDYDGLVYGGGATLAAGWEQYFGSLTATYMLTDLDVSDSSITTWIVAPKVGFNAPGGECIGGVAFWIGGMYQKVDENQQGDVSLAGLGRIDYDVELEEESNWNWLAGISVGINKDWTIELENGVGDRQHAVVTATYRF